MTSMTKKGKSEQNLLKKIFTHQLPNFFMKLTENNLKFLTKLCGKHQNNELSRIIRTNTAQKNPRCHAEITVIITISGVHNLMVQKLL